VGGIWELTRWFGVVLVVVLACSSTANAQATGQVWANMTFDWLATERLSYELDLEPKAQPFVAAGQPTWWDIDVTPNVEYAVVPWMDVVGELLVRYTDQSDDANTFELTPRLGVHLHILSRIIQAKAASRQGADREKLPRRRVVISTLVRLEQRNQFHNDDSPTTSSWRLRNRLEADYPFNRPKITSDGAVYLTTDGELFAPLAENVEGGAINQVRVRAGVGYRPNFAWRFEALYIWAAQRSAASGAFTPESHAIDVRIKGVF
jgi:hypothetical protein